MADDLKTIRDAWEKRDARGQRSSSGKASLEDDDKVRKQADAYVKANAKDYAGWENLSRDVLVKQVDEYREKGQLDEQWKVEVWLLHHFAPQNIGGAYEATVRVPGH
jgi:hypothetical protein